VCPEIVILFIGWIINGKYNPLVNLPTLSMLQIEFFLLLMTHILFNNNGGITVYVVSGRRKGQTQTSIVVPSRVRHSTDN
jgi:hypothetical protein